MPNHKHAHNTKTFPFLHPTSSKCVLCLDVVMRFNAAEGRNAISVLFCSGKKRFGSDGWHRAFFLSDSHRRADGCASLALCRQRWGRGDGTVGHRAAPLGHIMTAHAPLLNAITTLLRHSTSNRALKYCECAKSYFSNVFKGIMFCLPIAKVFKVLPSVLVDNNILRFTVHRFRICPIKIPKHNYVRIINGLGQKNLVKICALGFHIYIKAVYNIILCIVFVYRKHCSTPKHVHRKSSL